MNVLQRRYHMANKHGGKMLDIISHCCLVTQLCLTLCDTMDCSLPGSSIHGDFQARIQEWVAISFSKGSPRSRDQTLVSCKSPSFQEILYHGTTWKAKSKPQWDVISYLLWWLAPKCQIFISVGKDLEKLKSSYVVGRNVN